MVWTVAGISARFETQSLRRLAGVAAQLTIRLFLTWCLWRALYAAVGANAGLTSGQAVTYAMLGVFYARLRGPDRAAYRDALAQHIREGTVLYWYLRPLAPRAYHRLRALGDQAYGMAWAVAAYLVCLAAGAVGPPASAAALATFTVSMLLGQVVLYHLLALTDVASFWTFDVVGLATILQFTQSLFAGAIAPLWFFPGWFRALSGWLPFQYSFHVPVSIYVGRVPPSAAGPALGVQLAWCVVLAAALRALWRVADRHVVVQGG